MRPLSYSRAADVDDAVALAAARPGERVPRRRHDRGRPDPRRRSRSTDHLVDINELPLAAVEDLPDGGLRIGALARMSDVARTPASVRALPGDLAGAAARRLGAAAQHGLDGRQPAPAHALRVPARRRLAVQQARARAAAARRSTGSTAVTRSSARASTASRRIRPTSRSRSSRSTPSSTRSGRDGERAIADRRLLPAARRHARASSTRSTHGELIVGIEVPGAPIARRSVYLKFRDRAVVRVRAGVGRGGARRATTASSPTCGSPSAGSAPKPWRARRAEAALVGGPADEAAFRRAAARRARGARSSASTTRSRSSSPSGRSCAACPQR